MSQNKVWTATAIELLKDALEKREKKDDFDNYYGREISRLNQILDGSYVMYALVCIDKNDTCVGQHEWRHFDFKRLITLYGKYFMEVQAIPRMYNGRPESCPEEEMLWMGDIGKNGMCGLALSMLCSAAEEMSGKVLFYKENDDFVA